MTRAQHDAAETPDEIRREKDVTRTTVPHLRSFDLQGTWTVEVDFAWGPLEGQSDVHQCSLQPDGLFVQLSPASGIGRWSVERNHLAWTCHAILANPDGTPTAVAHVTARATLTPDGQAFEGRGTSKVYGIDGGLLAVNLTALYAARAPGRELAGGDARAHTANGDAAARLGHVALHVTDPEGVARFYRDLLGLRVVRRASNELGGELVALAGRESDENHELVLGTNPQGRHVAFRVGTLEELQWRYAAARAREVDVVLAHYTGVAVSFFVRDPEGSAVEVYTATGEPRIEPPVEVDLGIAPERLRERFATARPETSLQRRRQAAQ